MATATRQTEGREKEKRVVGGDGAGASGGDHRGLRLLEEPLDGFAVRLVAQLAGQLEDAGGAEGRHSDAPPAPVHLRVPVLGRGALRRRLFAVRSLRRSRHGELVGSGGIGRARFRGDC